MTAAYFEKVAQFGPDRGMAGIVAQPSEPVDGAPGVVLLNSGIIHRVGSNRVSVLLARAFAAVGFASLRFDFSGIGESERRVDAVSLQQAVEQDIADAMTFFGTKTGGSEFILMGLCSGAYDAMHAARVDDRVVGAMMVDLPGPFRNRGHTLHHLKSRLLRPTSWRNPLQKLTHYFSELATPPQRAAGEQKYVLGARSFASREWMEEHLAALLARDVRLDFVFTHSDRNYNHESQFRTVFPDVARHPAVSHAFFPNADHAFTSATERDRLVAHAVAWLSSRWGMRDGSRGRVGLPDTASRA